MAPTLQGHWQMKLGDVNCKVPCKSQGWYREESPIRWLVACLPRRDVTSDHGHCPGSVSPELELGLPAINICLTVRRWVRLVIAGHIRWDAWGFCLLDTGTPRLFVVGGVRIRLLYIPYDSQMGSHRLVCWRVTTWPEGLFLSSLF